MKKLFILCPLLLAPCSLSVAYSQSMVVNTTAGTTSFPTSQVSSVTFSEEEVEPTGTTEKIQMKRSIVFLGHSIWRNDNYFVRYQNSGTFVTPFTGTFKGRGYQTLLGEVFSFPATYSPGPDGGYSGYSLGGTSATDSKSIAVVAGQANNGWPSVQNAIWTIDFITNDFKRNIPLGTFNDYKQATGPATFYGAVRQLYDKIKELSGSDVIIVFSNALKRNNSGYTSTSQNTAGCTLADYELALLTCAAANQNWYFVDQNRLSGITDENLPAVTADGLHLNNLGYTMAVQPWIAVLRTLADK
ncbi:MAG: SGNH/GDSL hydrolase family protein [Bacteroidaceae bacterium]|nr:SGNH/GDSL hydrolase family protein [Bacteroidaceae bacterium]